MLVFRWCDEYSINMSKNVFFPAVVTFMYDFVPGWRRRLPGQTVEAHQWNGTTAYLMLAEVSWKFTVCRARKCSILHKISSLISCTLPLDAISQSSLIRVFFPSACKETSQTSSCNHQADSPLYGWPGVWSGKLQVKKKVWSYMTPNVLSETRCH